MKALQIMFDESLLAELDETADVREKGRSAVLREITREGVESVRSTRSMSAPTRESKSRSEQASKDGRKRAYNRLSEPGRDLALYLRVTR
jgi:hypothetical protein